jgi:prepilin signal peptidase PulO-like enzyme (type II secretory pathway)
MFVTHAASLILTSALIALAWTDFRTYRLPDAITLPLIAAGLGLNTFVLATPWASIAGAAIGYLAFVALETGYRRLRGRAGLGRGDAKLIAAGGAWCGGWLLPGMIVTGALSALVFVGVSALIAGKRPGTGQAYAFGPWLALGILAGWIYRAYGPGLYPVW